MVVIDPLLFIVLFWPVARVLAGDPTLFAGAGNCNDLDQVAVHTAQANAGRAAAHAPHPADGPRRIDAAPANLKCWRKAKDLGRNDERGLG
jgi:hypothetical protein